MKSLLLTLLFAAATTAHGELRIVDTDAETAQIPPAIVAEAKLTEIGKRPKRLTRVNAGRGMPLGEALKLIAPRGWKGYANEADMSKIVSWAASDSWVDAFLTVLKATGNAATIDWKKQRILLTRGIPMARKDALAMAPAPTHQQVGNVVMANSISNTWNVKSGNLLKETLTDWTAQAGWSLAWMLGENEDFRLEAGDTYKADFKTAVHGLINSLPPTVRIRAELRSDNTPPLLYVIREEGTHQ